MTWPGFLGFFKQLLQFPLFHSHPIVFGSTVNFICQLLYIILPLFLRRVVPQVGPSLIKILHSSSSPLSHRNWLVGLGHCTHCVLTLSSPNGEPKVAAWAPSPPSSSACVSEWRAPDPSVFIRNTSCRFRQIWYGISLTLQILTLSWCHTQACLQSSTRYRQGDNTLVTTNGLVYRGQSFLLNPGFQASFIWETKSPTSNSLHQALTS